MRRRMRHDRAAIGSRLRAMSLGAAVLLVSLFVFLFLAPGGCSSGGSTTEAGGALTSAPAAGGRSSSSDPNCTTALARKGASCTVDCTIPCGYMRLGTKVCSCVGDSYSMCLFARPSSFLGAAKAPACATPDGTTTTLKNTPCTTEWEECVGRDPVSGNTPLGCVCMMDPSL